MSVNVNAKCCCKNFPMGIIKYSVYLSNYNIYFRINIYEATEAPWDAIIAAEWIAQQHLHGPDFMPNHVAHSCIEQRLKRMNHPTATRLFYLDKIIFKKDCLGLCHKESKTNLKIKMKSHKSSKNMFSAADFLKMPFLCAGLGRKWVGVRTAAGMPRYWPSRQTA